MSDIKYTCDCDRPKPFKRDAAFGDIRKGDLVRVGWVNEDRESTRTGVADSTISGVAWYTPKGVHLCENHSPSATITILSRPETEPELPTTPGAVIKLWLIEEWTRISLGADGYWRGWWPDGDDMEVTGSHLSRSRGIGWDRFEVIA